MQTHNKARPLVRSLPTVQLALPGIEPLPVTPSIWVPKPYLSILITAVIIGFLCLAGQGVCS